MVDVLKESVVEANELAVRALLQKRNSAVSSTDLSKAVQVGLFIQQHGELVANLSESLRVMFLGQIKSATDSLLQLQEKNAEVLRDLTFSPGDWDVPLLNAALPPLAKSMGEVAVSQLVLVGVDPRVDKVFKPQVSKNTAAEWMDFHGLDAPPGLQEELPPWLVEGIDDQLRETFSEDYWADINNTTAKDIESAIDRGIKNGWTVQMIAKELRNQLGLGFEYYENRAEAIARTEAGNAINGAKSLAIAKMAEELLGSSLGIQKRWISALLETTRTTHSANHDTTASPDGMWDVGGVRVPWPAHHSLPANERVNCMCTIAHLFVS